MHPTLRKIAAGAIGALLVVAAACSDDGSSDESPTDKAQSAVCSDVKAFESSVDKLVDDVKSGNFGDASDQLSNVESSFKALQKSVQSLSSEKKSDLQSDVDSVKKTLGDLTSAGGLDDLESTLQKVESELKDTANTITDTLSC